MLFFEAESSEQDKRYWGGFGLLVKESWDVEFGIVVHGEQWSGEDVGSVKQVFWGAIGIGVGREISGRRSFMCGRIQAFST